MYTHHSTQVLWNGRIPHWFNVSNGVKQGGVLSPILLLCIDGLLISLCRAGGLGCHIGHYVCRCSRTAYASHRSQSPNKISLTWVKYDVTGDLKST